MKLILLLLIFLPAFSFASGERTRVRFDDHVLEAAPPKRDARVQQPDSLVPGVFQQDIDHFGQLPGQTFSQRFWLDSEYANAGAGPGSARDAAPESAPESAHEAAGLLDAPVIFHICGEADVDETDFLNDNAIEWAKALGAHLVYLEHRYYGKSLPFADLTSEHLRYLTLGNAVEDLATFQKWIAATRGFKGKWISVGGSYSGTLSAIYRQTHPELVAGALAASAPMISGIGELQRSAQDDASTIDPSTDTGDRQWVYEACTSLGFWMADGLTPGSDFLIPSSDLCTELFGAVALVDPNAYNQKYDQPFLADSPQAPSNILFTYGSEDIWTSIGLSVQTNLNPKIVIHVIPGAGHHYDLNLPDPSDSQDVIQARQLLTTLAWGWLGQAQAN